MYKACTIAEWCISRTIRNYISPIEPFLKKCACKTKCWVFMKKTLLPVLRDVMYDMNHLIVRKPALLGIWPHTDVGAFTVDKACCYYHKQVYLLVVTNVLFC